MRRGHPSHQTNGQGYLLTRDTITYFHDHYIDDARHDLDWRASPLLHADLPAPAAGAGAHRRLRPAARRGPGLRPRARPTPATRVSHVCFERQIHGFITMGRVLDEAHTAVALCAAELRRAFAGAGRAAHA